MHLIVITHVKCRYLLFFFFFKLAEAPVKNKMAAEININLNAPDRISPWGFRLTGGSRFRNASYHSLQGT